MPKRVRSLPILVAALGIVALCGCQSNAPDPSEGAAHTERANMTPEQKKAKQIEDIRNNPKMPQAAKDMAIAALGGTHMK